MKKIYVSLLLILGFNVVAQTPFKSVMQEQSEFYKQFNFSNDQSWDSLNNTSSSSQQKLSSPEACSLKKKVYGWHPYWNGTTYTAYNWTMLSDFCYFDYAVSPTSGQNTNSSFAWSTSAAVTAAKANGVKIHICASLFASHATFWATPAAQTTFINNMVSLLNSRGGNGVNIDFEGIQAEFEKTKTCIVGQRMKPEDLPEVEKALAAKCPELSAQTELLGELLGK